MKLTIGHLYPDMLNLYGDRGNIFCLRKRLEWRGIKVQVKAVCSGERVDFTGMDIVLLGGGSDREQALACRYLKKEEQNFRDYVEDAGVVLAVCGGYQLLGKYYKTERDRIEGLNILDIYTEWEPGRLTGDILLDCPLCLNPVVGFENHGGRTFAEKYQPLGRVICGHGNRENCGWEGVLYKNVMGTYLHGPLLPKNPELCDFLLERALARKYRGTIKLPELSDEPEYRANHYMVQRLTSKYF